MITGTFTCESGTVTVSINTGAGTHTAHLTSVGSIKYTFDITPDSVVIDRLMAIYSKMDCSWGLYAVDGQDLYDLLSAIVGKADVTVTVATWAGESFVFPFSLEAKDVSLDEKTQIIKTSFGVFVDDTVTVGDVWTDIATNHAGDIFDFRMTHGGGTNTYDAVGARTWMESALKLIFGQTVAEFVSYYIDPAEFPIGSYLDYVYDHVDPTVLSDDGKLCYVCIDVAGLTTDGVSLANDIPAITTIQSMAGHEGGTFGVGFSKHFYANRVTQTSATVSIKYDDVLELGFDKNFTAFRTIENGTLQRFLQNGGTPHVPNLRANTVATVGELNPNAEKSVNIKLNAGFPVMCAGIIQQASSLVNGTDNLDVDLMCVTGSTAGYNSYLIAFPASGALKITATLYGWGKVKPWELITFDSTCPTRYQSKTFRINDATYDFIKAQTKITAYEVT
jgi:hypothetical protein